jgi:hypothetical protein
MQLEQKISYCEIPNHDGPVDPPLLIERVREIKDTCPVTYVSMSLTSGLAGKLLLEKMPVKPNHVSRVIRMNTRYARRVMAKLGNEHTLLNGRVLLPACIGSRMINDNGQIRSWGEFEYNFFWAAYLTGSEGEQARNMWRNVKEVVDKNVFSDHEQNRSTRWQEYLKMFECVRTSVKVNGNSEASKPQGVILFPGWDGSLGCKFEEKIAELSQIPAYEVVVNPCHPQYEDDYVVNNYLLRLLKGKNYPYHIPMEPGTETDGLLGLRVHDFSFENEEELLF